MIDCIINDITFLLLLIIIYIILHIGFVLQIMFVNYKNKENTILKILFFYICCLFVLEIFIFILPPIGTIIYISQILKYLFPKIRYLISSFIVSGIIALFISIVYGIGFIIYNKNKL